MVMKVFIPGLSPQRSAGASLPRSKGGGDPTANPVSVSGLQEPQGPSSGGSSGLGASRVQLCHCTEWAPLGRLKLGESPKQGQNKVSPRICPELALSGLAGCHAGWMCAWWEMLAVPW